MPRPALLVLLLLPVLPACAGAPPAPAPPPALRYGIPAGPLVYLQADTATVGVTAGGRTFDVGLESATTWSLAFEPEPGGARVAASVQDMDASVDNPMAGVSRADEGDVAGPVVFTLDPRGEAVLVSQPALEGAARELFSASTVVHHVLPRLPGRSVTAGATWTDTIRYSMEEEVGTVSATTALTYTVAGDTTVAGLPYLLVRFEGQDRRTASGETGGMTFTQDVAGSVEGFFLWDQRRGVLHTLEQRSDLRGTMDAAASPTPLDVRVQGTRRVELQPAPPVAPGQNYSPTAEAQRLTEVHGEKRTAFRGARGWTKAPGAAPPRTDEKEVTPFSAKSLRPLVLRGEVVT